jgi:hypothetical protein
MVVVGVRVSVSKQFLVILCLSNLKGKEIRCLLKLFILFPIYLFIYFIYIIYIIIVIIDFSIKKFCLN